MLCLFNNLRALLNSETDWNATFSITIFFTLILLIKFLIIRYLFKALVAIIAISIKMVGLLLITGLLIIPAAMARNISDSPQKMVLFSIIGGLLSVIIGLFSSLEFNTSSGPSIIAASLFLFILSLLKIKQSVQLKN